MDVVIFDFDGTIADSFTLVVNIVHELTHRSKLVTPEEIAKLRSMQLIDVAKAEHVAKWRIPFLLLRGRKLMNKKLNEVKIFVGIEETIKRIHADGHQLFIMSSNSGSNVRKLLRQHELEQYFTKIYGGAGLLSKARALKRIMRTNHIKHDECTYIGDELRDIEACKEMDVRCIAVAWGYNTSEILKQHHPYALVRTPEELLRQLRAVTIK